MKVLVLDQSYQVIGVIGWLRAFSLVFEGEAEIVETYDKQVRTVSKVFNVPSVIRKTSRTRWKVKQLSFSKEALFFRDGFACQYCGFKGTRKTLTFDHVVPKSKGGKTNWENITTACHPCNVNKANLTVEKAGYTLHSKPKKPHWSPIVAFRMSAKEIEVWKNWLFV